MFNSVGFCPEQLHQSGCLPYVHYYTACKLIWLSTFLKWKIKPPPSVKVLNALRKLESSPVPPQSLACTTITKTGPSQAYQIQDKNKHLWDVPRNVRNGTNIVVKEPTADLWQHRSKISVQEFFFQEFSWCLWSTVISFLILILSVKGNGNCWNTVYLSSCFKVHKVYVWVFAQIKYKR